MQNSTIGTSAGLPLGLTTRVAKTTAGVTCDPISNVMGKSVCNGASNKATSTQLVMSLATAVSSTPVQTSTSTTFSMLSQQSFSNFQSHSVPRLVTQLGIPSHVTASKNLGSYSARVQIISYTMLQTPQWSICQHPSKEQL